MQEERQQERQRLVIHKDQDRIDTLLRRCDEFVQAVNSILELAGSELEYTTFKITPEWLLQLLDGKVSNSQNLPTRTYLEYTINELEVKERFSGAGRGLLMDYSQAVKIFKLQPFSDELLNLFNQAWQCMNSVNVGWFEIADDRLRLKESAKRRIHDDNSEILDDEEDIETWQKFQEAADIINKYAPEVLIEYLFVRGKEGDKHKYLVRPSVIERIRKRTVSAMVAQRGTRLELVEKLRGETS